jgi:2-amino-4-hydroxy-6-hydroxymethyldihydropteridine diphosphokinase
VNAPVPNVLLSIGSNIDPDTHVPRAIAWLRARHRVVGVSPWYASPPVGVKEPQPDFVNLAVRLETRLPARALRESCRRLEEICGRRRTADRFAPRTMDVDVILIDGVVLEAPDWHLPDPLLAREPYLLVPAVDIWPDALHPELGCTLADLLGALPDEARSSLRRRA